jgi:hypothetical protein
MSTHDRELRELLRRHGAVLARHRRHLVYRDGSPVIAASPAEKLPPQQQVVCSHIYDLFPLLCAQLIMLGRLPITSRDGVLYLVWARENGLRYLVPAEAMTAGFWTPCHTPDKQRFRREQRRRTRISDAEDAFPPPFWTGEPRPTGYNSVVFQTCFPSDAEYESLKSICRDLGFPWSGICLVGSYRFIPRKRKSRAKPKPEPIPAPDFSLPNKEGFNARDITTVIEKHRWAEATCSAVFEIVYEGRRLKDVATERDQPRKKLSQYVWEIRTELRRCPKTGP